MLVQLQEGRIILSCKLHVCSAQSYQQPVEYLEFSLFRGRLLFLYNCVQYYSVVDWPGLSCTIVSTSV